jgi:signal transduction histidine kinase
LATAAVVLVAYHDISALKTTELLKDEFITLATDRLRNPLAVIQGYTQTLEKARPVGGEEAEVEWAAWQTEAREAILQATARLLQLTEELLEVSLLSANGLTLHLEPADMVALTRRVCTRIQATTTRHQVHFVTDSESLVVRADQQRMEQVVAHVLSNAVNFSPGGGEIVVTLNEDTSEGQAELTVRDAGIGIPAPQQAQIFGRFMRAANAQHEGIPGSGLGLYLTRELVRRHGGRIWFHSVQGQGTTFTVVLPLLRNQH